MINFAIFIVAWLVLWFAGCMVAEVAPGHSVTVGMFGGCVACWIARAIEDARWQP
jgi:hypothetical protein